MAEVKLPDVNMGAIGNVLAGLALGFLVDNVALGGVVSKALPAGLVAFVGFIIFAGAVVYGYKAAKRAN